jgi:hypothetical protein
MRREATKDVRKMAHGAFDIERHWVAAAIGVHLSARCASKWVDGLDRGWVGKGEVVGGTLDPSMMLSPSANDSNSPVVIGKITRARTMAVPFLEGCHWPAVCVHDATRACACSFACAYANTTPHATCNVHHTARRRRQCAGSFRLPAPRTTGNNVQPTRSIRAATRNMHYTSCHGQHATGNRNDASGKRCHGMKYHAPTITRRTTGNNMCMLRRAWACLVPVRDPERPWQQSTTKIITAGPIRS